MRALGFSFVVAFTACVGLPRVPPSSLTPPAPLPGADEASRAAAAFTMGQAGFMENDEGSSSTPAAWSENVRTLSAAATGPETSVRKFAVEALGKLGGPYTDEALLTAAADAVADVRGAAALALFRRRFLKRVPEYSSAVVQKIIDLTHDENSEVRWRALYAFTRWPEPRAREALVKAARGPDARERLFAVRALGQLGVMPPPALLNDPDVYVRAETVTAYGAAKAADRLPQAVFSDASMHVRAAAADAVAATGRSDLAGRIETMADEDSPMPRGRALVALARLRGNAERGRLNLARRNAHWWVRAKAYEAFSLLPGGESILREGIKDPDTRVAATALEALAATKAVFVDQTLAEVLRDPKSKLEMIGTAADAALARKSAMLFEPLLNALLRVGARVPSEVRDGLRKAATACAEAEPSEKNARLQKLSDIPIPRDDPKEFARLPAPVVMVMETAKGDVEFYLDSNAAPRHAAAIAAMARRGLYNGTIWHRVVTAFVVQGGDPRGSGWGDAGYRLIDEPNHHEFSRGTLGMPKAGPDTGGCQLFVSLVPTPHLDGRFTAFGRVLKGMSVLDTLEPGDVIKKAYIR